MYAKMLAHGRHQISRPMLIEVPKPKKKWGGGSFTDGHTEVWTNGRTYGWTKGRGVTFYMLKYHLSHVSAVQCIVTLQYYGVHQKIQGSFF